LEIEGNPGESVVFRINATSGVPLDRFTIVQSGNLSDSVLIDTIVSGKSFSLTWNVRIPEITEDAIQLVFSIVDEDGNVNTDQRLIRPVIQNTLVEYNNNLMYSCFNTSFNAFDLKTILTVTYDSLLFDSVPALLPDLREFNNNPAATPFDISGYWYSPSGGKFVKTTSLNFNGVSKSDILNYFNGGFIGSNLTDSLHVGDIYAFKSVAGTSGSFVCLIKIDKIDFGSTPARYLFSVKK
jgi:hypothetical protein